MEAREAGETEGGVAQVQRNWSYNSWDRGKRSLQLTVEPVLPRGAARWLLFFSSLLLSYLWVGGHECRGQMWKVWEMNGLGVDDVKSPKNQSEFFLKSTLHSHSIFIVIFLMK